jgi:hypothetical protein
VHLLLKESRPADLPDQIVTTIVDDKHDEPFRGIRCPLCSWQPQPNSRWSCSCIGTPEPFFESCGTVWNTFSTGGRCPGCQHLWRWTTCLRCQEPSLHVDWYENQAS